MKSYLNRRRDKIGRIMRQAVGANSAGAAQAVQQPIRSVFIRRVSVSKFKLQRRKTRLKLGKTTFRTRVDPMSATELGGFVVAYCF